MQDTDLSESRDLGTGRRRVVSIGIVGIAFVVAWAASPALIAGALLVDLVRWTVARTPMMASRLVGFGLAYLTAEVSGLLALLVTWLVTGGGRNEARRHRMTFRIQLGWATALLEVVETLFGLEFDVSGRDSLVPSPYLLFARHASIVDNLLASRYVSAPHGIHVRYVMKHELRVDPCLDIAGSWLPNVFVRRGSGDSERERAAVARLGATMGADEAVLIYPEGTRFSVDKLERARRRLTRSGSELGRAAAGLRNVLPPRLGGPLALLEATDHDVVVMAHRGLDGFARVADIWRGAMVDRRVAVAFWRIARSEIPTGRSERAAWLFDVWTEIDRWIAAGPDGTPAE